MRKRITADKAAAVLTILEKLLALKAKSRVDELLKLDPSLSSARAAVAEVFDKRDRVARPSDVEDRLRKVIGDELLRIRLSVIVASWRAAVIDARRMTGRPLIDSPD